jgi:hypothetical protein
LRFWCFWTNVTQSKTAVPLVITATKLPFAVYM